MKTLLKISVTTTSEAEETISSVLEKIIGQPAFVYVDAEKQTTVASVYASKTLDWSAATQATLRRELQRLRAGDLPLGSGRISVAKVRHEDWAESWKRHFKPIEIGSALLLKPSWSRRRPKKNQAVVVLDPGLSFGTGQHPTTRFCLEQIVAARKPGEVQGFLDIGTGSGILAIAAARLGYRPVAGTDLDLQAIRIARENAKQNEVLGQVRLVCQDLLSEPLRSRRKFDLVCANLIFDVLLEGSARIASRLKPAGVLVLAGILRAQFPQVRREYEKRGLRMIRSKAENEWVAGAFGWRGERRHGAWLVLCKQHAVHFRTERAN